MKVYRQLFQVGGRLPRDIFKKSKYEKMKTKKLQYDVKIKQMYILLNCFY